MRRSSLYTMALLMAVIGLLSGPAPAVADDADCCVPVAFVAVQFEVTTYTYKCCCPEQECVEREGETIHRFGGYAYEYACGDEEQGANCEDPAAIACGEPGILTDVEHESTLGVGEEPCECVEQGCWLMPPDCLDPNTYFWCVCTNPPYCILTMVQPGCADIEPGGDD